MALIVADYLNTRVRLPRLDVGEATGRILFSGEVTIVNGLVYIGNGTSPWEDLTALGTGSGGIIADAPSDGTYYARRNAAWVAVPSPGISHATSDGNYYASRNGGWTAFTPGGGGGGLADAPNDGTAYLRKSAAWVATVQTFLPDQTTYLGSIAIGGGLVAMTGGSGAAGKYNTAYGINALLTLNPSSGGGGTQAYGNTALGVSTLKLTTYGWDNTAVGYETMLKNTVGYNNVGLGPKALYENTTGHNNHAIGIAAMYLSTTGVENTAVGGNCGYNSTTSSGLVLVGYGAGNNIGVASYTTAIGYKAMGGGFGGTLLTGPANTAVGNRAMFYARGIAEGNTAVGNDAMLLLYTGINNVAVGGNALTTNEAGLESTAVGYNALRLALASANTAVGAYAFDKLSTGVRNVALGWKTGFALTTATDTVVIGYAAGLAMTIGAGNTFVGASSGNTVSTGTYNTGCGSGTTFLAAGDLQVAVGANATTGASNATAVGPNASVAHANSTGLGNGATSGAINEVVLGNGAITKVTCATTTITTASDQRLKTASNDNGGAFPIGLDFICDVKIRDFTWNANSVKEGIRDMGVFAQELHKTAVAHGVEWMDFATPGSEGRWSKKATAWAATPGKLLYPLIVAVQDLKVIQDRDRAALTKRIEDLETEVATLRKAA